MKPKYIGFKLQDGDRGLEVAHKTDKPFDMLPELEVLFDHFDIKRLSVHLDGNSEDVIFVIKKVIT